LTVTLLPGVSTNRIRRDHRDQPDDDERLRYQPVLAQRQHDGVDDLDQDQHQQDAVQQQRPGRRDVDQGRYLVVGAGLGDDRAAVGVSHQYDRPVLRVEDQPRRGGVAL
jgi:hypothetical protein